MFTEIKRVTKADECGQVITRLCKLNEKYRVEQVDTYWNRVEEDDAYSLEEAEAMFAEWSR